MSAFKDKWRMITTIISSKNNILISMDGDDTSYVHGGNDTVFAQLFQKLQRYVPQWLDKHISPDESAE